MTWPRDTTSSAIAARTNGVMSWYSVICVIGVIRSCTRPMTSAATNVTVIERSRPIRAAASDEMTTVNTKVVSSSADRSASRSPARPDRMPQPNQAAASTRRTGTPSVPVISRSLAIARIAVPSLEKRRKAPVPAVMTTPSTRAMTWVQLTWTWPAMNPLPSVGNVIDRDCPAEVGHSRSIAPNSTSARPSVATAWISGPRPARAGPKTTP